MDPGTWMLFAACFLLLVYYIYRSGKPKKDYPPGPWKWPLIGDGARLSGPSSYEEAMKVALEYGPIVGLRFGPMNMVLLTDAKLAKEAFSNPVVTGKPDIETFHFSSDGKYGILNSDGPTWVDQRRFALRHLRDLGFGKTHMEDLIMEDVNEFISWLKSEEGNPIMMHERFNLAVLNSIWMLVNGTRYSHNDATLLTIVEKSHQAEIAAASAGIAFAMPWLAKLLPGISGYGALKTAFSELRQMLTQYVEDHKQTIELDGPARDLLDAYLMEMKKQEGTDSSFNEIDGPKNLVATIADLFSAGHGTTAATLQWFFYYVLTNPRVQDKIHQELDRVVGKSRQPNLADRQSLVYLEAAIHETLRYSSIVSLGAPHELTHDFEFHGYKIPKGHMITPNIYGIHHHPDLWDEPEKFKPERFISEDGKTLLKNENLIPFSIGKRQCVGELMARAELFLFTANLLHRFHVQFDPSSSLPSDKPLQGFVLRPQPYKVVVKDRFS